MSYFERMMSMEPRGQRGPQRTLYEHEVVERYYEVYPHLRYYRRPDGKYEQRRKRPASLVIEIALSINL